MRRLGRPRLDGVREREDLLPVVRRRLLVCDATLDGLAGAGEVDELMKLLPGSPMMMSMLAGSDVGLAAWIASGCVEAPDR